MAALFILSIVLCVVVFRGGTPVTVPDDSLSFGAAVELAVAMPLSWLPLISDYTREAEKPFAATLASTVTYGVVSCWMYLIGMGAAIYTGQSDIAQILLQAGLGVVGLLIVVFSTVTTTFLGIPFITWVAIVMFLLCFFIQEYTAFGRHIYAVGTNENIPRSVGVSVEKVKIGVFTLAGFLFGVAGVIGAIRLGQGQIAIGDDKMFPAQAAVVVGGTSLAGGKGGVVNTIVGVLIMTVLDNGLVMLNVNPNIRTGVQGVIILVAVILTAARGAKVISK